MMMLRKGLPLAAVAAALAVALPRDARAAYSYQTTVGIPQGAAGGASAHFTADGVGITLTGIDGSNLTGINKVAFAQLAVSATDAVARMIDLPYSLYVTVNNNGAAGTFEIQGRLAGQVSSTQSTLQNSYTALNPSDPLALGRIPFTIDVGATGAGPSLYYTPATVNMGGTGGLGGVIIDPEPQPVPVPEPSSMVLTGGMGAVGLLGLYLRRRLQGRA